MIHEGRALGLDARPEPSATEEGKRPLTAPSCCDILTISHLMTVG